MKNANERKTNAPGMDREASLALVFTRLLCEAVGEEPMEEFRATGFCIDAMDVMKEAHRVLDMVVRAERINAALRLARQCEYREAVFRKRFPELFK